MTVLA